MRSVEAHGAVAVLRVDSTSIATNARLAAAGKVQAVCESEGLGCMLQWAAYMAARNLVQQQ